MKPFTKLIAYCFRLRVSCPWKIMQCILFIQGYLFTPISPATLQVKYLQTWKTISIFTPRNQKICYWKIIRTKMMTSKNSMQNHSNENDILEKWYAKLEKENSELKMKIQHMQISITLDQLIKLILKFSLFTETSEFINVQLTQSP